VDFAILTQLYLHIFLPFPITYECTYFRFISATVQFLTAVLVKICHVGCDVVSTGK